MAEKDQILVSKTLAGERNAFGDLVERYSPLVHGLILEVIRHPDAVEDLVQEVFCKAYEELSRLRKPVQFASWLSSIATNKAQDWLRHQQVRYRAEQAGNILPLVNYTPLQDKLLESSEMADALWVALDRLSPEYRRIVVLHYLEGCSLRDIAQFLGLSLTTIKWRLARAQKRLKQDLLIAHYQEVGYRSRNRREVRDKIMIALPVVIFFRRDIISGWLSRWGHRLALSLGLAGITGLVGMVSQNRLTPVQEGIGEKSGFRVRRMAMELPEMSMFWQPRRPQNGERVRIEAAGVEGEQVELHYITDPWTAHDQVVSMKRHDDVWVAEIEMPDKTTAVFFYMSASEENARQQSGLGPLYRRALSPTDRKILQRYRHSFLVYNADGKPVQNAEFHRATMAKYQGKSLEESLSHLDRELVFHPENFSIYSERWRYMLEEDRTSASLQQRIKIEQATLIARFPDRPEPLRFASSFWMFRGQEGGIEDDDLAYQEEMYHQLYRRFPDSEEAQDSGYLMANKFFFARNFQKLAGTSQEFISRFPQSRHLDAMYWYLLIGLGQVDATQAGFLADSLIAGTSALHADPGRERSKSGPPMRIGGFLPEGLAYSLRFDLLSAAGDSTAVLSLAQRLIASGVQDPLPYLHIGERLAHMETWSLMGLKKGMKDQPENSYPQNLPLAIEMLETGLPMTEPEKMFGLPGFILSEDEDSPGMAETRAWYLERIAGWRGRFLQPLGRCYLAMRDYSHAAAYLEDAAALQEKKPRHARLNDAVYLLLGEVYEKMGEWRSAEAAYLQIVKLFHSHPKAEDALERVHRKWHGHLKRLRPLLQTCYPEAPNFLLTDADGHPVRLSGLRGKVILAYYIFMPPVSAEFDEISALLEDWAGQFTQRGLEVLYITGRKMADLDHRERSFRTAVDDEGMKEQYSIGSSSLFLIDRQGRLRLRQELRGGRTQPEQEPQVVRKLQELLAEDNSTDLHLTSKERQR